MNLEWSNVSTLLIRWGYAEDEDALVEIKLQGNSVKKTEPDFVLNNIITKWKLFNAAVNPSRENFIMRSIYLPFGQIRVETVYCENKKNAAIVQKFFEKRLTKHK